jgi:hypothetical protein
MIKKHNTNKNDKKNITISYILKEDDDDVQYYRDILLYTKLKSECKIEPEFGSNKKGHNNNVIDNNDDDISDTEFKVWYLTKWLLKHNRRLREAIKGSHERTSYKVHSEKQKASTYVNRLKELGLVDFRRTESSDRNNNTPTSIYEVTRLGLLIASIVEFKTLTKGTQKYKDSLKSFLNLWIDYIPEGNKDESNYNYYFIEGLVEKSLESHDDILLSFTESIREHAHYLTFNFGDLRYKVNNVIFEKLVSDIKFRELYLNWLKEFCRKSLIPANANTKDLIKFQFKLDVEAHYDRSLSQLLNFPSHYIKTFQRSMKPNIKNVTLAETMKKNRSRLVSLEIVFDYNLKYQWEQVRNKNLLNCNKIIVLGKCTKCGNIFPLPLEIWNEIGNLSDLVHKYGPKVNIYDIDNNTNAQYLKIILSGQKEPINIRQNAK